MKDDSWSNKDVGYIYYCWRQGMCWTRMRTWISYKNIYNMAKDKVEHGCIRNCYNILLSDDFHGFLMILVLAWVILPRKSPPLLYTLGPTDSSTLIPCRSSYLPYLAFAVYLPPSFPSLTCLACFNEYSFTKYSLSLASIFLSSNSST